MHVYQITFFDEVLPTDTQTTLNQNSGYLYHKRLTAFPGAAFWIWNPTADWNVYIPTLGNGKYWRLFLSKATRTTQNVEQTFPPKSRWVLAAFGGRWKMEVLIHSGAVRGEGELFIQGGQELYGTDLLSIQQRVAWVTGSKRNDKWCSRIYLCHKSSICNWHSIHHLMGTLLNIQNNQQSFSMWH